MLTIRAMSDGKGYSSRHLEHADYYAEGERVVGHWQGRGAELLGLSGQVKSEDFEALRQGLTPANGEFLRQRQSADRVAADGTTQSHGRHLYDFTISAPKSVSIMAVVGGDKRLIDAHEKAVTEALRELETHAATRVRQEGANTDRATSNLAIAVYHHDTSRELDPQLHTHAVAANLTYDGAEGRWKALQASGIYERRAYLTEVYRNSLALLVRSLGYEIENRRDDRGRDSGFEIRGVSSELLGNFSQRSQQRDKAVEEFTEKNGRPPTDNEVAVLIRETRADKLIEISTDEVRFRQRSRLTHDEASKLEKLREDASARQVTTEPAKPSLQHAEDHVFERVSVARDHEILTEALRHGRGHIDHSELKGTLTLQESSGAILRDRNEIATVSSLQREREMVDFVNRGIGRCERLGAGDQFVGSDRLKPEQKHAVAFVLDSRDRAVNIRGAAGTGKTSALQELRRGLIEANRKILAVAPTMSAVEELQKVGFSDALTVERLLQDKQTQSTIRGSVVILDEAGMVSGRQMHGLLKLAEQQSARIVFSGDTKQIQSVEAGDALRVLENESRLKSTSLTQVQRQTTADYRDAIQELRRDPEAGFEKLDRIGAVREVGWADRAQAVAQAYAESKGRDVLVVCATHDEIDRVTEAIRASRTQNGDLGESLQVPRDVSLNWTAAQKSDYRNYRAGQRLTFHRTVRGITKNETLDVVRAERNAIVARNYRGEERTLTAKQSKSFEVYERRTIEVAAGDKLLLTANRRDANFRATNGEIVTVSRVDKDGTIRLDDGRDLPANYNQFTHGYAVTAHRSQGKSVDSVIISGDGMQKELFYVAASRGWRSVQVITSDRELLRDSVARSTARQSASELARKARPGLHQGSYRGVSGARALAAHTARDERPSLQQNHIQPTVTRNISLERTHEYSFDR
jgi:conjugative relaxase-like TrwC/TraI family protein